MRFALAVIAVIAVIALVAASPVGAQSTAPDEMLAIDRENMGDWRVLGFFCRLERTAPQVATELCEAVRTQVRAAVAQGNLRLVDERGAFRFSTYFGMGIPFLVAEVSTAQTSAGVAVHVSLRAQQRYAGPVRTRDSIDAQEAREPTRRGPMTFWENSVTGYLLGPDAVSQASPAITNLVREFFVTLYGARR